MSHNKAPAGPPELPLYAHKGTAGRLLALCGSAMMPGAAVLVARAAQRAGAGLVKVASEAGPLQVALAVAAPECIAEVLEEGQHPGPFGHAALAGPGLGAGRDVRLLVERLLESAAGPVLLDADALNAFAGEPEALRRMSGELVITPHPLEAERLLGRPVGLQETERIAAAQELAEKVGGVCVLKGQGTVLAGYGPAGQGDVEISRRGTPAMATAGSGDVLAGILGAYLASWHAAGAGTFAFEAASAAVWVHARAGELSEDRFGVRGTVASDLIDLLPEAARELGRGRR